MPLLLAACAESVAPPSQAAVAAVRGTIDLTPHAKIDVLFMVDNSNLVYPPVAAASAIPDFLRAFSDAAGAAYFADLHLGVVSSDYGAGATGGPGCSPSPGGDGGRLQAIGKKASSNCRKPTGNVNFVHYVFGADPSDPENANLPPGQDLVDTLTCMAAVGDTGCGFEHPLESVHAALSGNVRDNEGFLRPDALLAIVFTTDEDDASAPPDTDVFDKNRSAEYGFEDSYSRQTRFAVVCCPPGRAACDESELEFPPYGSSHGPLAGCRGAPNDPPGAGPGKQFDVRRYIDRFTRPSAEGGLKDHPLDVMLFAVDGPETPFEVVLSNPGTLPGQPYIQCPQLDEQSNPACVPMLQHACVNQNAPQFQADPAVRLNQVVRSAGYHGVASVCDGEFNPAFHRFGSVIAGRLGLGCVPFALPVEKGELVADCQVADVSDDEPVTRTPIPRCGAGAAPPCWRLEGRGACRPGSPDGVSIAIDRNGASTPPRTRAEATCRERS